MKIYSFFLQPMNEIKRKSWQIPHLLRLVLIFMVFFPNLHTSYDTYFLRVDFSKMECLCYLWLNRMIEKCKVLHNILKVKYTRAWFDTRWEFNWSPLDCLHRKKKSIERVMTLLIVSITWKYLEKIRISDASHFTFDRSTVAPRSRLKFTV